MREAERAGTGQPREEKAQGISMSVSTQEGCKKKERQVLSSGSQ